MPTAAPHCSPLVCIKRRAGSERTASGAMAYRASRNCNRWKRNRRTGQRAWQAAGTAVRAALAPASLGTRPASGHASEGSTCDDLAARRARPPRGRTISTRSAIQLPSHALHNYAVHSHAHRPHRIRGARRGGGASWRGSSAAWQLPAEAAMMPPLSRAVRLRRGVQGDCSGSVSLRRCTQRRWMISRGGISMSTRHSSTSSLPSTIRRCDSRRRECHSTRRCCPSHGARRAAAMRGG